MNIDVALPTRSYDAKRTFPPKLLRELAGERPNYVLLPHRALQKRCLTENLSQSPPAEFRTKHAVEAVRGWKLRFL